jgi:hypothetical protein
MIATCIEARRIVARLGARSECLIPMTYDLDETHVDRIAKLGNTRPDAGSHAGFTRPCLA